MSIQLLDKTRKFNRLLHNSDSNVFVFSDICKVLGEVLRSNVTVISKTGKVLGISKFKDVPIIEEFLKGSVGEYVEEIFNERLLGILSTKENAGLYTLGFEKIDSDNYYAIIIPIDIAGERLGTLFIYRKDFLYDIEDIILGEYGNTVVGLEMVRSISEENDRNERKRNMVKRAINSLSELELKAIKCILEELGYDEGLIVASRVANKNGITRSVIVNGLKKLESAGVIKTQSNGMKGTYIKVINNELKDIIFL